MKAIIPVAGAGTRLRPFTYTQPKSLIPVAGKPIISYIIEDLASHGIEEFVFVVGYFGDKIIDYVKSAYPHLKVDFVFQNQREGLGHAIYLCREFISPEDELIIMLGDSLVEIDNDFFNDDHISKIAIKKVKDPTVFGVVEYKEDGEILKLIEKPKFPKSNFAMVGLYKIVEVELFLNLLEKYNKDDIRTNGEIQLTDVLNEMLSNGVCFTSQEVSNWLDVGNGDILLQSNSILLKKYGSNISVKSTINNTVLIDPVSISEGCEIHNSIIGPNITIGENTKINNSIIKEGIIGSYSSLNNMQLTCFVVGSDSSLKGASQTLTVGDNTELDFSKSN